MIAPAFAPLACCASSAATCRLSTRIIETELIPLTSDYVVVDGNKDYSIVIVRSLTMKMHA